MNNVYTYSPLDRVIWDTSSLDAIQNEVKRLNLKKVFIVSSSTLSKKTDEIDKIIKTLGKKFVGLFDNCIAHSPIENVIECADKVQKNSPDIIITIGGGTPIDTVKVVQLCYSLGINSADELKLLHIKEGLDVEVVTDEEIYNEFSGGIPDATAIKQFLRSIKNFD